MKISVIIPIYNAAPYLPMCVKSLMEQTLYEVEYIFINDASTDNSLDVLNVALSAYPDRHTKIVDLPVNGGISNARNVGLQYATGSYVTHCDSDDWVDRDMYKTLYELASEADADVAASSFVHEYGNRQERACQLYTNDMELNMRNLLDGRIFPSLWCSIVKRSLIMEHNLNFPVGLNMGEDLLFNVKVYYYANMIVGIDKPFYHYRHREDFAHIRRSMKSINSDIAIAGLIANFLESKGADTLYRHNLLYRKFFSKLALVLNFDNEQNYEKWLRVYPESNEKIWQYKQMDIKLRIELWLAAKGFWGVSKYLSSMLKWQYKLKQKIGTYIE